MIVQCAQCNTRFKLDDAKIKEEGVKVRCSKCKYIFVVKKESSHEEAEFDTFLGQLGSSLPDTQRTHAVSTGNIPDDSQPVGEAEKPTVDATAGEKQAVEEKGFELQGHAGDREPDFSGGKEFDFEQFNFAEEPPESKAVSSTPSGTTEHGEMAFTLGEEPAVPSAPSGFTDEGVTFDFGEVPAPSSDGFETKTKGGEEDISSTSIPISDVGTDQGEKPSDNDFSFMFDREVPEESPLNSREASSPRVHGVNDVPSNGNDNEIGKAKGAEGGEFDFSAVDAGALPTLKETSAAPVHHESVAERETTQVSRDEKDFFALPNIADEKNPEEELPPLSITSRRRGVSASPVVVIVIAVFLVLMLAGGGVYFLGDGTKGLEKFGLGFIGKWFGLESREDGSISIRNTTGKFIVSKEAGELFIVRGEAVNNFRKPRASIQVKALLYGPKGEVAMQKSAYCGNMLSDEQLVTLPMSKLEEAMNNQLGDSLSNLSVQPGKSIPFLVVFYSVPKEVAEFGIEVTGSTVASR